MCTRLCFVRELLCSTYQIAINTCIVHFYDAHIGTGEFAASLKVAYEGLLARVRALVCRQGAAVRRHEATRLIVASEWLLARVDPFVRQHRTCLQQADSLTPREHNTKTNTFTSDAVCGQLGKSHDKDLCLEEAVVGPTMWALETAATRRPQPAADWRVCACASSALLAGCWHIHIQQYRK